MNIRLLILLIAVSFSCCTFASYRLHGNYHVHDDGTLSVNLYNRVGLYYIGSADENADGTLDVSVQNIYGELYRGTATKDDHGMYELDLQNVANGETADGVLRQD